MTGLKPALVIGLLSLGIAAGNLGAAARSDESLERLLPAGKETAGWEPRGKPQVFNPETLFDYIDGGAEIYLEYGFRRLAVQEYRNEIKGSIVIEVFEMESPPSAFGMYTFKSASAGRDVAFGQGGQLADYYLNFWKGNTLFTLTGSDEKPTTLEGLKSLGAAVAGRIPARGDVPEAVSLLPGQGGAAAGLKYFRGPLGVYNSYAFFTNDVFGVKEAVKSDYKNKDGYSLYLFLYGGLEASRVRFAAVEKAFRLSDRYTGFIALGESRFRVRDAKGRAVMVLASGSFILASVGTDDQLVIEQVAVSLRTGEESRNAK